MKPGVFGIIWTGGDGDGDGGGVVFWWEGVVAHCGWKGLGRRVTGEWGFRGWIVVKEGSMVCFGGIEIWGGFGAKDFEWVVNFDSLVLAAN